MSRKRKINYDNIEGFLIRQHNDWTFFITVKSYEERKRKLQEICQTHKRVISVLVGMRQRLFELRERLE